MEDKEEFRIKNKPAFFLLWAAWLLILIGLGAVIGNPMITAFLLMVCSTASAWQTNLDEKHTNIWVLSFALVDMLLALVSGFVPQLLMGQASEALSSMGTVVVVLAVVIGVPVLIVWLVMKKNKVGWKDSLITQKKYLPDEWQKKQQQSFGMARRMSIMSDLVHIGNRQIIASIPLGLIAMFGVDLVSDFAHLEYREGPYLLTRGLFVPILIFWLIFMCTAAMWYAIVYKRLEICCLHLGVQLPGAMELNEAARMAGAADGMAKAVGVQGAALKGIGLMSQAVPDNYLLLSGQKPVNHNILRWIGRGLVLLQVLLAAGVFAYSFL